MTKTTKGDPIMDLADQTYSAVRALFPMNEVPHELVVACDELDLKAAAMVNALRHISGLLAEYAPESKEPVVEDPAPHRPRSRSGE